MTYAMQDKVVLCFVKTFYRFGLKESLLSSFLLGLGSARTLGSRMVERVRIGGPRPEGIVGLQRLKLWARILSGVHFETLARDGFCSGC